MFAVALLGVVALTVLLAMHFRSGMMVDVGPTYRGQNAQQQLLEELEIVFSNQELCTNLVSINSTAGTFSIGTATQAIFSGPSGTAPSASAIPGLTIQSMTKSSPVAVASGGYQSSFTIVSTSDTDPSHEQHTTSVSVIYNVNTSGLMTSCQVVSDPVQACQTLGAAWIPATGGSSARCGICETLGGTWSGGICTGL